MYQLAVILIGLFIIQGSSRSLIELWQQKGRVDRARKEITELKHQEVDLQKRLEYYRSDEYVEKIARDKLLMGKEGEEVVLLSEEGNQQIPFLPPAEQGPAPRENWQKWMRLFGW